MSENTLLTQYRNFLLVSYSVGLLLESSTNNESLKGWLNKATIKAEENLLLRTEDFQEVTSIRKRIPFWLIRLDLSRTFAGPKQNQLVSMETAILISLLHTKSNEGYSATWSQEFYEGSFIIWCFFLSLVTVLKWMLSCYLSTINEIKLKVTKRCMWNIKAQLKNSSLEGTLLH